ncbi:HalOD1 output domain-containing protein [Halosimplex pelagicum]|uniref:Halobacterial output domain-containing protein n=1 Tax=Halosimplex pelagicum TaxID=869886 RepID=A0A7D5TWD8_9EURY|nr:HalOD1 output domain-containing protein [Halosimplex pelagicum]QLH84752.1 hypothetical protein HZS54_25270 [Halosimplex pelagicum]
MIRQERSGTPSNGDDRLTTKVVRAVAADVGADPTDLPPLWTALDPDALDRLVDSGGESLTVTFEYRGRLVTVGSDREVRLGERDDAE